jgi:hypothetical protein
MIMELAEGALRVRSGPHAGEWRVTASVYLTDGELPAIDCWPVYTEVPDRDRQHDPGGMCWCERLHSAREATSLNRLEARRIPSRPDLAGLVPSKADLLAHIAADHEALRRFWLLIGHWRYLAATMRAATDPRYVLTDKVTADSLDSSAADLSAALYGPDGDPGTGPAGPPPAAPAVKPAMTSPRRVNP